MSTKAPFPFPKIFEFPPFFTRQQNAATWKSQVENWTDIIMAYCRYYGEFTVAVSQRQEPGVFRNERINRALNEITAQEIMEHMVDSGVAEWIDTGSAAGSSNGGGSGGGGEEWYTRALRVFERQHDSGVRRRDAVVVYWRTPREWAEEIEKWMDETGVSGGMVLTMYEVVESDKVQDRPFSGLHPVLLMRAVKILEEKGKIRVMRDEAGMAVGMKVVST